MKKSDKKAQKQQQHAEFDASVFVREPVQAPVVVAAEGKQEEESTHIGDLRGVQHVAPVWTAEHARVDTEGDVFQDPAEIVYPLAIQRLVSKHLRFQDAIALEEANTEATTPADNKKKAEKDKKGKAVATGLREHDYDDAGRLLPRIFIAPDEVSPNPEPPVDPPVAPPQLLEPRIIRELQSTSDPMGDVFNAVESIWQVRPAQAINSSEQFLWQSIYPQDEDGRPVYNPSGKYHVKLFFGGSWRMVVVDDRVPVADGGGVLLCQSSLAREMWPTILAKAIYKLMYDVGYSILSFFGEDGVTNTSYLSAIATHMLTGWLPDISAIVSNEVSCLELARKIARAGVPIIPSPLRPTSDIPNPPFHPQVSPTSRTRKGREQESAQVAWEREYFVHHVNARERRVQHLQNIISQPRKRAWQLVWHDKGTDQVKSRPVLAASIEQSDEGEWELHFLLEFALQDVVRFDDFSARNPLPDNEIIGDSKLEEHASESTLTATPVHAFWMNAKDIHVQHGTVVQYYVGDTIAHSATYNRIWDYKTMPADTPDDPKEKSKKKGTNQEPSTPRKSSTRLPPGQQAPTFVIIQPNDQADGMTSAANAVIPERFEAPSYWTAVAEVVDEESRLQQSELFVFGLSDIMLPAADSVESKATFGLNLQIQEVWFGEREEPSSPVIPPFRVTETNLPFLSGRIQLPSAIKSAESSSAIALRIRALDNSGLHVQFGSPFPVAVGDAAVSWASFNGKSFTASGSVTPTAVGVRRLFLRLPLAAAALPSTNQGLYSILHIADQHVRKDVVLGIMFSDGSMQPLAPLDLAVIRPEWWQANGEEPSEQDPRQAPVLVGWVCNRTAAVPSFSWELTMLLPPDALENQLALLPPLQGSVTRFQGEYTPNKYLRVFKDVLTVPQAALPLAFNMSLSGSHLTRLQLRVTSSATGQLVCDVDEKEMLEIPALYGTTEGEEEFLLEVTLDEAHMQVPDAWKSNHPHVFKPDRASTVEQSILEWQLEFSTVDGSAVNLRHDSSDLKRLHELKTSWEVEDPGRSQRAQSALELLRVRHANEVASPPTTLLPNNIGEFSSGQPSATEIAAFDQHVKTRVEMNGEDITLERQRELKRACLKPYELEVKLEGEQSMLFTAEQKQMDREDCAAALHHNQVLVAQLTEDFRSYNQESLQRTVAWVQQMEEKRQQQLKEFDDANQLRTKYNEYVRKKNEALSFLYQSATDAVAAQVKQQQKDSKKKK